MLRLFQNVLAELIAAVFVGPVNGLASLVVDGWPGSNPLIWGVSLGLAVVAGYRAFKAHRQRATLMPCPPCPPCPERSTTIIRVNAGQSFLLVGGSGQGAH